MRNIVCTLLLLVSSSSYAKEQETITLGFNNTVILNDNIDAVSHDLIVGTLIMKRAIVPENEPIYLLIASGGGEYLYSRLILGAVNQIPGVQVVCRYCGSGAGLIFLAAKVPRLATLESQVMMHEMALVRVTAAQASNPAIIDNLIYESSEFNNMIYSVIGMSEDDYLKKITSTEWTVTGKDLLKFKLADKIVKIKCENRFAASAPRTCGSTQ